MTSNRISLASGVVPEFGPLDTIRAAVEGRFDAVGLWIEPPLWNAQLLRDVKTCLADSGLELLDVEVVWFKPGPSDPDMGANAAKLRALCLHAEPAGMRVSLEFGLFTEIKNIGQAMAVISATDHPAAALLIDPLHLARSGGTPREVAAVNPRLLPYAQFCDAPLTGPSPDDAAGIIREAIDERLQTGDGALPLAALLHALPAGIPLSIELRSKSLRDGWPDPGERARETARATRRFLDNQTAENPPSMTNSQPVTKLDADEHR